MAIQRLSQEETMVKALTLKEQKEIMEMEGTFPCRSSTFSQGL
jgi:hypothetical protein